jgi:branched-chain amino acid transport system permease protein
MVLVGGGLASFWGPLVGAAFFILARDLLGAYTETWLLWYGLIFMLVVMFKPEGIAGMWQDAVHRLRGRKTTRAPAPLAALFR